MDELVKYLRGVCEPIAGEVRLEVEGDRVRVFPSPETAGLLIGQDGSTARALRALARSFARSRSMQDIDVRVERSRR